MGDAEDSLELMCEFPKLAQTTKFLLTSPKDSRYNCIAWAAGDNGRYWWPDNLKTSHWPAGLQRVVNLDTFEAAFATLGYERCESDEFEPGFEKIAIFVGPAGTPKHAARQLPDGYWTSKCGKHRDITHDLKALEGSQYGDVKRIMRRPKDKEQREP